MTKAPPFIPPVHLNLRQSQARQQASKSTITKETPPDIYRAALLSAAIRRDYLEFDRIYAESRASFWEARDALKEAQERIG